MGAGNSRSSFKNNTSNNLANSINFVNSEQFSFNNDGTTKSINKDVDILTKFTWNYGGNSVFLTGSFNRWKQTIPLEKQGDQFSITILLPRGLHYYKFIVDGEWRFSPQDPSIPDSNGNINNYIDTTNFHPMMDNKKRYKFIDKDSEYSGPVFNPNPNNQNNKIQQESNRTVQQFPKQAPLVPSQYESCDYLNDAVKNKQLQNGKRKTLSQMMQIQNQDQKQFQLSLNKAQLLEIFNSAHYLAPPSHVTVDHLIQEVGKDYNQIAITQRFKSKYTTYRYYS